MVHEWKELALETPSLAPSAKVRVVRVWCMFVARLLRIRQKAFGGGFMEKILMDEKGKAILTGFTGKRKRSQLCELRKFCGKIPTGR